MALTQYESQLSGYLQAELQENLFVSDPNVPIIRYDDNAEFTQGNLWKTRQLIEDTSTWQSPVAGTNAGLSAFVSDAQYLPVLRRGHFLKLGDAEMARDGAQRVLSNAGTIFARHFAYNFENAVFGVASAAMSGSISATHLNDKSSSAFTWAYLMNQIYSVGQANRIKYVFMHPTVATSISLYNDLDKASATQTTPIRPFRNAAYAGMRNGLHIFTSTLVPKVGSVYETYAFGDNSIILDYQTVDNFAVEVYRNHELEMGANVGKYLASFAVGIAGLTYGGSPTALAGATDAEIRTKTNWSRMTNIRDNQIPVVCVRSL